MSFKHNLDTIVAISTPPGYGGIAIVRLSGKNSLTIAKKHFRSPSLLEIKEIEHKKVYYGFFITNDNEIIDECLMIYMASPKSYTGEDVVEFQIHGGNMVAVRIIEEILKNRQLVRFAEPGEFTYRAFLHGKKDLIQSEAIESLIHSKNYFQQRNAVKQLTGYLSDKLKYFFDYFNEIRLQLEASINFPEDVEQDGVQLDEMLIKFYDFLKDLISSYNESKPYVEGISALIIGKPNVGKSSFMNKILEFERVIVSPYPGTTRDFVEESIMLEGVPLKIIDTAGIRVTSDPVEKIGIERAKQKVGEAKIIFAIFDASENLTVDDLEVISLIKDKELVFGILNKIDKGNKLLNIPELESFDLIPVSLLTGEGIEEFKKKFKERILKIYAIDSNKEFYLTQPRHYEIICDMKNVLEDLLNSKYSDEMLLFALSDLNSLYEKLTGVNISSSDLEKIFSRFCIGK